MPWVAVSLLPLLLVSQSTLRARPVSPPPLSDCQQAVHVLNRLGFGPAPGQIDRILGIGIQAYIDIQLHPETITDPQVIQRLEGLPTIRMADSELVLEFEKPIQNARKVAAIEAAGRGKDPEDGKEMNLLVDELVSGAARPQRVLDELTRARVIRALYSEAQLNEVLVDFWMNHFNVFAGKDVDRAFLATFEREVIRPHIWGCFRDLLLATAKSPAMLFYLDNSQSVSVAENRLGAPDLPPIPFARLPHPGLNENYARELLELHTMGVDGGYSQQDVSELARVLTGWTLAPAEEGGGFLFRAELHDVCPKTVVGLHIVEGRGLDEGEEIIGALARHPSTARHISYKLCQRLVADEPPQSLVERAARVFLKSDGDLRQVVRTIVESPEFFDPRFYRAKVKTPFEYVVSAIRGIGAVTSDEISIAQQIAQQGEPLYLCAPPTGYGDTARDWINTGALLSRWNFVLALALGRFPGAQADPSSMIPAAFRDPRRAFSALKHTLLGGDVSASTNQSAEECVLEPDPTPQDGGPDARIRRLTSLLLASPEFQRR
jgi:uncharacterized protein (DUF1800 family)